jgi:tetratricopeptide (TPR) repeat protein
MPADKPNEGRPPSAGAAPGPPNRDAKFTTTMKWIGAAGTVLTLVFALQRLVTSIGDAKEKRNRATEVLRVADTQQRDAHYEEALSTLRDGEALNEKRDEIRALEEDVAMQWLRHAAIAVDKQTFADIVHKTQPILVRGLATPDAKRRADLTAHLGWADFLLWKESGGERHPEEQYGRAVAVDSLNAFAHSMWGHWILYRRGPMEDARAHFASAVRSGAHRDVVRDLEVSAIGNLHDETGEAEMLRLASELRHGRESIAPDLRRRMADVVCFESASRSRSSGPPQASVATGMTPEEDLLAAQWMFDGLPLSEGRDVNRDYCIASFQEAAGHRQQALASYESLLPRLPKYSTLETGAKEAIRRLSRASSAR